MGPDRRPAFAILAAAVVLLWPAVWNGYPIVFADTGTYLSQAIHRHAGWDRPVFYSLFMLPLHAKLTLWPVLLAQALLTAWVLWLVCRVLLPHVPSVAFVAGAAALSVCTWLSWIVSELMPDLFTPLLVLVFCLLAWVPGKLSRTEQFVLMAAATLMIASQQSSVALACAALAAVAMTGDRAKSLAARVFRFISRGGTGHAGVTKASQAGVTIIGSPTSRMPRETLLRGKKRPAFTASEDPAPSVWSPAEPRPTTQVRRWLLLGLPTVLAVLALCSVNLAAYGRFAVSPFGNVFLLARVIYDGPGLVVLHRDCPIENWRLCPFLGSFPRTSDDFLWSSNSPLRLAGGPKTVSQDADAIIAAALWTDPAGEAYAALENSLGQLTSFASGDGLNAWPAEVSPWIEGDFPAREAAAYADARQQSGGLSVPPTLAWIHSAVAICGVMACAIMLPIARKRRAVCAPFLLTVLLALPLSAAVTGVLSAPHDRYQARIMWLPTFIAVVSLPSLQILPRHRWFMRSRRADEGVLVEFP